MHTNSMFHKPCQNCGAPVLLVEYGGTRHFRGQIVSVACSVICAIRAAKKLKGE